MVLGLTPSLVGQGEQVPLESHEVFVARTAEEMMVRGNYLVPHFNDTPRINKPPLSYWLLVGVDLIGAHDGRLTVLEARLVSVGAGLLCVMCVYVMGVSLGGPLVGWLGAVMLSGSVGFMLHTHSARPDMLYAAWIALAAVGYTHLFVHRQRGDVAARGRWATAAVVVGLVLATMTKGPWAPLGLLLGVVVGSWTQLGRHEVRRVACPVLSVVSIAVPFVCWYGLMLLVAAHEAGGSWGAEIGRRLDSGVWWNWLEPYYPVRLFQLAAPWWPLYAMALVLPLFRSWRCRPGAMFTWWVFVASLAVWQVLPGRRLHYALPALVLVCPLLGVITARFVKLGGRRIEVWRRASLGLRLVVATVVCGCVVGMAATAGSEGVMLFGVLGCAALGVGVLLETRQLALTGAALSLGVVSALLMSVIAFTGVGWSLERTEARTFARAVGGHVSETSRLVAWRGDWEVAQYYLSRTIPRVGRIEDIARLANEGRCVYVLSDRPLPGGEGIRVEEGRVEGGYRTEIGRNRLYRVVPAAARGVQAERLCTFPGCAIIAVDRSRRDP